MQKIVKKVSCCFDPLWSFSASFESCSKQFRKLGKTFQNLATPVVATTKAKICVIVKKTHGFKEM
jgi:hypothetical protein